MKITQRALSYAVMLLKEAGVHYEEASDLDTLVGSVVSADGRIWMVVDERLHPATKIALSYHMFGHAFLGHLHDGFGARLEYALEERAELPFAFRTQEQDADNLMFSWLEGENLPPGFAPLAASRRDASLIQACVYQLLVTTRKLAKASGFCKVAGRWGVFSRIAAWASTQIHERKRRMAFRHLEKLGRKLWPELQKIRNERRTQGMPDDAERKRRVPDLVGASNGGDGNRAPGWLL